MIRKQREIIFSKYNELYDLVIPKDHFLRQLNDLVDFSFVYTELLENYSLSLGRKAIDPVIMFKYLLLKIIYEISDVGVVARSLTDLSFKYFLNLAPEDTDLINPSSLTKFRKLRLRDSNLLDLLINKSVELAIEKGVLKSKTIIVDSTHSKARYNQKTPREELLDRAKFLRKEVYRFDQTYKDKFPKKERSGLLEETVEYCQEILNVVKKDEKLMMLPQIKERLDYLSEAVEDDLEKLALSKDLDAKTGYKSADTSFFGYKSHIAISEERIITAATVTSGERADGKELQTLIEKSQAAGIDVEEVIGDAAYSGKDNLQYTKNRNIKLISKLNPSVSKGYRKAEDEFEFNKDAGMIVCPQGHLAIRKARIGKKNQKTNQTLTYYFDIEKCKICSKREGCYKPGAKSKTYSISIKSEEHKEQIAFQQTEEFKSRAKERYKIEAKNSEIKHQHGYDVANAAGLFGMEIQSATTFFVVNLKRIIKLSSLIDNKLE